MKSFSKLTLWLLWPMLFCFSCDMERADEQPNSVTGITEIRFTKTLNPELPEDIILDVLDLSEISPILPLEANIKAFTAEVIFQGDRLEINGSSQNEAIFEADFTKPIQLSVIKAGSASSPLAIHAKYLSDIPVLKIQVRNNAPIANKEDYLDATMEAFGNGLYETGLFNGSVNIRGRGNSTWGMPKKPYKLRLNQSQPIFDLPEHRHWVLLANYADKTLMRTHVATYLSEGFGMAYTPREIPVELVVNGVHQGSYQLIEQIRIDPNRLNIAEMTNRADPSQISGGYIMEIDQRAGEPFHFTTPRGALVNFKRPSEVTQSQFDYAKNFIESAESVLYSDQFADPELGYRKYYNVEDFIDWFLVNEITKNQDARDFSSIYFFLANNDKLSMGPIWDFDLAIGNVDYSVAQYPTGWWVRGGPWFSRLFEDPAFRAQVKERWNIHQPVLAKLPEVIDNRALKMDYSQAMNFAIWPILDTYVWPNPVVTGSYEGEVQYIREWLEQRLNWMDGQIQMW
ncbi:CotH kinase family protein [Pararhodonellum marinum]|uniref:CotH kinase family protein n=1 Tax=Pararhodonellum marinum TaxID=2755358 RepID=UPI00188EA94F|nr:CotH kinase family protein [Pararhodonellum marinum]